MRDDFKFRSQAFGFNKKDVQEYICDLCDEKEQNEKLSSERISSLESENAALSKQNGELSAANEELKQQLSEVSSKLADAVLQRENLNEELNVCRRTIIDNEREFNIKNEQIHKLRAENEDYSEQCAKYSEIARDVGKTMMEARQHADDIVNESKQRASEIDAQAGKAKQTFLNDVMNIKQEIQNLKLNLSDLLRVCDNRIGTLEMNVENVTSNVNKISAEQVKQDEPEEEKGEEQFF